jgi:hypothetical protein
MKKKMLLGGTVNVAAALCTVLCLGFILLDIAVLKTFEGKMEGWDGVGIALLFALSAAIEYPATLLNAVFQCISGGMMLGYAKRGKGVHKALRVIAWVFGVVAAFIHGYFAVLYFSVGFVFWGVLTALPTLLALASPILTTIAHKEKE